MMKAIVWTDHGPPDVLQLQLVERAAAKDNDVLIRIIATTVETGNVVISLAHDEKSSHND